MTRWEQSRRSAYERPGSVTTVAGRRRPPQPLGAGNGCGGDRARTERRGIATRAGTASSDATESQGRSWARPASLPAPGKDLRRQPLGWSRGSPVRAQEVRLHLLERQRAVSVGVGRLEVLAGGVDELPEREFAVAPAVG